MPSKFMSGLGTATRAAGKAASTYASNMQKSLSGGDDTGGGGSSVGSTSSKIGKKVGSLLKAKGKKKVGRGKGTGTGGSKIRMGSKTVDV